MEQTWASYISSLNQNSLPRRVEVTDGNYFSGRKERERWTILGSEEAEDGKFQRRRLPYQSWLRDFRDGRGVLSRLCRGMLGLGSGESGFILPESPRVLEKSEKLFRLWKTYICSLKYFPYPRAELNTRPGTAPGCGLSHFRRLEGGFTYLFNLTGRWERRERFASIA